MNTPQQIEFRAERTRVMKEGQAARNQALKFRSSTKKGDHDLEQSFWDAVHQAHDRYRTLLPDIPIARSPLTDTVITWGMDTVDLDGWFWESDKPTRRPAERDATFRLVTGAMRLHSSVTWTAFRVKPGPGAPYVIPRILDEQGVVAVITQVPIGPHTSWPITYFSAETINVDLENSWGDYQYQAYGSDGESLGWNTSDPNIREYDFDLNPWIASEKLQWVAPSDPTMTLRQGTDGCPYLNLPGLRKIASIYRGEVRYVGVEELDAALAQMKEHQ